MEKMGDKYLHESGNGMAVEEKDRVLEAMVTEIRSKHDACTRGEGCKRMYLGKGTQERKMSWERDTVQSAMYVMIGCSGVEDFWHVTSECVGGTWSEWGGKSSRNFRTG